MTGCDLGDDCHRTEHPTFRFWTTIDNRHIEPSPNRTTIYTDPHKSYYDNMRKNISGFRKKAKGKISKFIDKLGEGRTNVDDPEHHRPASSSQSEPGIVAEDRVEEDISIGVGKSDPRPDNPLPVSQSAVEIGHDHGGSDDKANAGEIDQRDLLPHLPAQTESGPSREEEGVSGESTGQAHPHPESDVGNIATPLPAPQDGETDSMWTAPFR